MKDMAGEDLRGINKRLPDLEKQIYMALIPKDADDTKNVILEIRAGTGGEEAALFAGDLFRMYKGFAAKMGWKLEVMETSESDLEGYKEIIAEVSG
ncbi:MAG TPA: peptide chain release factor 1, partial [Parvularcula sp.]|nr:peptide chain release factor 1 [Parvularcula sp.]